MELGRRYLKAMQDQGHEPDRAQLSALGSLARVQTGLEQMNPPGKGFARLRRKLLGKFATGVPVRGVYLWGGVGRGKTFLMDLPFPPPIFILLMRKPCLRMQKPFLGSTRNASFGWDA